MCLEAVKKCGLSLGYVKKQTKEICLEAVKQNGYSLKCVNKQTKEICLEAVKNNINNMKYVNIKYTKFIYNYLKSINFKSEYDDYNFMININMNDFKFILNVNYDYSWIIKYLKQNLELCKLVINDDVNFSHINFKKTKLCLQVIKIYNQGFEHINKQYIQVLL